MVANLERFQGALTRAKDAAQKLNQGEEHTENLGEDLRENDEKETRLELIRQLQAEIGHQFIVWLFSSENHESAIKIKKA